MSIAPSTSCSIRLFSVFLQEHSVGRFRAYRDVPLPYDTAALEEVESISPDGDQETQQEQQEQRHPSIRISSAGTHMGEPSSQASAIDLEPGTSASPASIRRRRTIGRESRRPEVPRGLSRVGTLLHDAHAQDFERRKKPELEREGESDDEEEVGEGSSEEEEEEEEEEREQERENGGVRRAEGSFGSVERRRLN